ncbi:MAG TPA: Hsp20/alpha crystallin family protein [Solirubrobacteraceae bacterium]|jgi:HSP20 family protein|nr:Hsp20/alpha crystallin family protein [Solirubrobacteraceae bacterium]
MTLVRWEPSALFGNFFDAPPVAQVRRRWVPAIDLVETAEEYLLRADLPGLGGDDVKIELDDGVLTVSGERRSETANAGNGYRRIERASGSFSRSLTLPAGIDAEQIKASFTDGVLEVHIPRPEQRKPHRVTIETGSAAAAIEG